MAKYSPDEKVTHYTEDEWFDYLAGLPDDSPVRNIEYTGEAPLIYTVGSGSVQGQIGYRASCVWLPIFTCDKDVGSSKTVSTSHTSGVDFIGYTQENNSWVTPYYKMSPAALFNTYTGTAIFITQQPSQSPQNGVDNFNAYASYPGIIFQEFTNTLGLGCGCNSVSQNTSIQMNIELNNVT